MSNENGEMIGFKGLFEMVMTSGIEPGLAVCISVVSNGIHLTPDDDLPRRCIDVYMPLEFWWHV